MKNVKRVGLFSLSILSLGLVVTGLKTSEKPIVLSNAYSNTSPATYYKDISDSLKDTALLNKLHELNEAKLVHRVGYNNMPSYFDETDPGSKSGEVTSFYSGNSARYTSQTMNREHVWPASRTVGGRDNDPLEDDIHMVRPTLISENSGRGNKFFATTGAGWDPATFNVPSYRGDSARIIFYCAIADVQLKIIDLTDDNTYNHTMGKLSELLQWNLDYKVADREKVRNEAAESLQGNRNPFIDHPEYACRIWGNTNSTTKKICGMDKITGFTLSSHARKIKVGNSIRLGYTIEPEGYSEPFTVSWSSSDESIATVNKGGLIEALKVGEATITATIDGTIFSDSCVITVVSDSPAPKHNGCGGNIITSSVILSTLSILGIALLLIRKKAK